MTSMAGQNDENDNSDIAKMNNTEGPKETSESGDSGKENGSSTNEAKNNDTSEDIDMTGISASIVQATTTLETEKCNSNTESTVRLAPIAFGVLESHMLLILFIVGGFSSSST